MANEQLDQETLGAIRSYFGRDPRVPIMVRVEVLEAYDPEEWAATDFLHMITKAIESIPPDNRESAIVKLGGYEESSSLTISYQRLQTNAEAARDFERGLQYARERRAAEREKYEALKAKFGDQ